MVSQFRIALTGLFCSVLLASCASIPESQLINSRCQKQLMDHEKIQCYRKAIVNKITQRLTTGTRHLTASDWPFEYLIRLLVDLDSNGTIQALKVVQESSSRHLNNKVVQSLERIKSFVVPKGKLFDDGRFHQLSIYIKPGRTPILGAEKKIPDDIFMIYLPGPCATRSQQC